MRVRDPDDSLLDSPIVPPKINFEQGRLASFGPSWPHADQGHCSRLNMARAGFYYTGRSDIVQCFCCLIKLQGWDPDKDEPWQRHHQSCLFGTKKKREGELTIGELIDVFAIRSKHLIEDKFSKILDRVEPNSENKFQEQD